MKKKILYISYDGMTDSLGEGQVINYLIGLKKYNYEFDILSFEKPEKFVAQKNYIEALLGAHKIGWYPQIFHTKPPIISKVYDKLQLNAQAIKLYKKHKYDLIHCRGYMGAEVGLNLNKRFAVKFLFDMRGFWADEKADGGAWNTKKWFWKEVFDYYKKKEKAFVSKASHIISLTYAGKTEIATWPFYNSSIPISVIPCCADTNHFAQVSTQKKQQAKVLLNISQDRFVVSYLGSLGSWYMLQEMILLFKEILKLNNKALFLIITNSEHEPVEDKLKDNLIAAANYVLITVPFSKVPQYMYAADCCISFIKPVYSKISSSPVKIGEILSMGIPIISNSVGDMGKIFLEENIGIEVKDFSQISIQSAASKMNELENLLPQDIRSVAIKNFSLKIGVEKYAEVYKQIFI